MTTLPVSVNAKQSDLYGAAPNAIAFNSEGDTLYVANGSQNAIAVMSFDPADKGDTLLKGLIPVGWYPTNVKVVKKRLFVTSFLMNHRFCVYFWIFCSFCSFCSFCVSMN